MSETCLKLEKTDCLSEGQLSLMELYTRLNQLEQENRLLKADKKELQKENIQLRSDINELHNRLNGKCEEEYEESMKTEDLSYVDEYAKGFELLGDNYKL